MNSISIQATKRSVLGSRNAKSSRKEGMIPAVVYGGGSEDHVLVSPKEVKGLIYSPDFNLAQVDVEGESHRCIVKNVQFHPVTDEVLHIDFLKLQDGVPVKVEVPVRFFGVSPGVKAGGKLIQQVRKLKIKAKPENLVDEVKVDISSLQLGQVLRVKSVDLGKEVDILVSAPTPLANIEIPRALKSAAAAEAKGKK